ncbi:MAG: flagellar motor switch protein FliN [Sneathiella sp.]|nr:flagellar motor switch protein FliN [Sneathiella sp.]MDF2365921.1 flagellar motor switch protein FliN [Sneathiella sp.]
MAEDEELNLEDLNKTPATDTDVAVQEEAAEGMALDGTDAEDDTEIARTASDLEAVFDIPVHVTAVLGKSRMRVSQLLKLGRGAVIELDRKVGEAIDIYVNNRLVARGEVVVVEDRLGVTMTEIIKADRR